MCEVFTLLAKSSDYRHISVCEHGMIHLAWDHSTVYLPITEFEGLAQFVSRGIGSSHARLSEGRYHVALTAKGYYQLWMNSAGILLSAVDSLIFVDLLRVALQQAKNHVANPLSRPTGKAGRNYEPTTLASLNSQFFIN